MQPPVDQQQDVREPGSSSSVLALGSRCLVAPTASRVMPPSDAWSDGPPETIDDGELHLILGRDRHHCLARTRWLAGRGGRIGGWQPAGVVCVELGLRPGGHAAASCNM